MANFTVRVELHKAEWTDYERLHAAMQQKGFSRQITSDDGKAYHARVKALRSEARQLESVARKLGSSSGKPSKTRTKASKAKA